MDIETKIFKLLDSIKSLSMRDKESIQELLEHNEWGVALETLCASIFEDKLDISQDTYLLIKEVGSS
ncbi:MafI family immunity protein [Paenibacillus methanolicus]|uniref:MafI family immunity protein n=1 Tax=Paenibacillus methanolicus TaxID=582686 RepID=UPI0011E67777